MSRRQIAALLKKVRSVLEKVNALNLPSYVVL